MKDELFILWTNDNPIVSEKMVCMYAHNAVKKKWWDEVTIIIWGATAKYAATDKNIRNRITGMQSDGVKFSACISCAEQLGVCDELAEIGIELKKWGEPLTEIIKKGKKLITV